MSLPQRRIVAMTGATGFVGAETLDQLLASGFAVRALARRVQPEREGVAWIVGALDDAAALDRLVQSADIVLHIAGAVNAPDRNAFAAGNIGGTAAIIAAMKRAAVLRLIHVSSIAARERELSDYCWSKAGAEDQIRASSLDWTMVRPPAVYGPRDTEFRELLRVARHGFLPVPSEGRASLIHVRDLAALLVALCSPGGDAYASLIWEPDDGTPGGLSHTDLAAAFGRALGRNVRSIPTPRSLLKGIGYLSRLVLGTKAKLTPDRARYMCHPDWVSNPEMKPPASFWSPRIGPNEGLAEIAKSFTHLYSGKTMPE